MLTPRSRHVWLCSEAILAIRARPASVIRARTQRSSCRGIQAQRPLVALGLDFVPHGVGQVRPFAGDRVVKAVAQLRDQLA